MLGIRLRTLRRTRKQTDLPQSARAGHRSGSCALVLALCILGCATCATAASAEQDWLIEGFSLPTVTVTSAPVLTVSGQTVQWNALGSETYYEIAISNAPRGAAGRTTQYLSVARKAGFTQSYTPTLEPEQTAYVGVSAENGPNWSGDEAAVTQPSTPPVEEPKVEEPPVEEPPVEEPPVEEPKIEEPKIEEPKIEEQSASKQSAPVIKLVGKTLHWAAVPGVSLYTIAIIENPTTTRDTTYKIVSGTSYTPAAIPGKTVNYGLSASVPGVAPWAREVTISYPSTPPSEPTKTEPTPPPILTGMIIGTNDGAGWGTAAAKTILAGHIAWTRVEIGTATNTVPASVADGFKVLAIAGNIADGTPLSQIEPSQWGAQVVSQIQANPGISIAEAGNEMYYKGGVANPVQYGKMYLAAVNDMKAASIHIPLLFNMWGDYSATSGFSSDTNGGGWLRDAVKSVPGLAAAILANGLSTHPYGALGENYDDDNGVNVVGAQESIAHAVLGSTPTFYITEFGYALNDCGISYGACSQQEQASKLHAAYKVFLSDPHVGGIWWYQSHDDSSGQFGYMNNDGTIRPAFGVLTSIALEQGQ